MYLKKSLSVLAIVSIIFSCISFTQPITASATAYTQAPRISATASSVADSLVVANITDGNTDTFWSSSQQSQTGTQWIYIDMGQSYNISRIRISPRMSNGTVRCFPVDFKFQYNTDGSEWTWTDIAGYSGYSVSGNNEQVFTFDAPITARYLRLYVTKFGTDDYNNYFMQIAELNADYEEGSPAYTQAPRISTAASSETGDLAAEKVKDRNTGTFWSSSQQSQTGAQWIYIDMGRNHDIKRAWIYPRIIDGAVYCFPVDFKLQYSTNGTTWTDVSGQSYTGYATPGNSNQVFTFSNAVTARYLRVYATRFSADNYNNYYMQIAELHADSETAIPTPEPAPVVSGTWDTYSDTWVATDKLGRTLPTYYQTGAKKQDKYVGIFYHLWNHTIQNQDKGQSGLFSPATNDIYNVLTSNIASLNNSGTPPWGPYAEYHYWGMPLFGYYDLYYDKYVQKKHAQMLSDAGVDTIMIDLTNYGYGGEKVSDYSTLISLSDAFLEVRAAGGKTPQITFFMSWTGADSAYGVTQLYNNYYSQSKYQDLWFIWQGKPLIIADKTNCSAEIQNFFTFRTGHPEYTAPEKADDWSWLSAYPQSPSYTSGNAKEEVVASVAQNWSSAGLSMMSDRDSSGNFIARGRSFHNGSEPLNTNPVSASYPSEYGYNFQEQLDRALQIDPSFLMITGWNEWEAMRFDHNITGSGNNEPTGGAFCDLYTPEFSRDIEPTRTGGLDDNYYMQLVAAIRKFKGISAPASNDSSVAIAINGEFSDWSNITQEFRDNLGDAAYRNYQGIDQVYTNTTGRNDFKLAKVARDANNIYFYVETLNNITSYTDANWMRLFIKTNSTDPNWSGYNYVVNRTGVTSAAATLEKSTGGWGWNTVSSNIQYKVNGNKMEIAIPRSALGLSSSFDLQFKWSDNMQVQGDVLDFYVNGDTAPNGRFNYYFNDSVIHYTQVPRTSASGSSAESGWEAVKAIDGITGTSWSSTQQSQTGTQWINIDMGQNYNIQRARVNPRVVNGTVYCFPVDFRFQYSTNGTTWTDVPGQSYTGYAKPGNTEQVFTFSSPVTARYLRLYASKFGTDNAGNYFMQIAELNADYDASLPMPLTQVPRNSAAGSSAESGWEAAKAIDGNTGTSWSSTQQSQTGTQWINIDMGQNYNIQRVRVNPRVVSGTVYCFPVDFKFQYSTNGTNWTDVPGQSYTGYAKPGNTEQVFTFSNPVTARYLRLYATKFGTDNASNYFMQIAELNADY